MRLVGGGPGMSFYVTGSDDEDSLVVEAEIDGGQVGLQLPVQSLPWRDASLIEKYEQPRRPYGCGDEVEALTTIRTVIEGEDVHTRTDVSGAASLTLEEGLATIRMADTGPLSAPCLRIAEGARMPVAVRVLDVEPGDVRGALHVVQLSGGRRVGGATVVLDPGATDRPQA